MAHAYIGLQGILDKLGGSRGTRGDEHVCRCPAHDDHKPSLYVRETDKGIVLNCVVGCRTEDICDRIGVKMSELFKEPPRGSGPRQSGTGPKAKAGTTASNAEKPARTFGSYDAAYGWMGQLQAIYPYRDDDGKVQFEVARILEASGSKTFRQHRPAQPESGKLFPIRLDVPAQLRETLIYRQPEVKAAIAAGERIYIVEGEKDCETMARLGLCATTNAGGGGKNRWKEGHSDALKGAKEVIIIPDNDAIGEGHGQEVYRSVSKVCGETTIVHLKQGYPALKDKGDFTDLVEAVGGPKALEILGQCIAEARESQWQKALDAYSDIPGYGIDDGRICQIVDGTPKALCNFVALPIEVLELDNGVTVERSFRIIGWDRYGRGLPTATVPVSKFRTMDWVMDQWEFRANIAPGNTVKDKLRWILTEVGDVCAKRRTIYGHCGWRRIDGHWAYLYQGGCIGAENVNVDMGQELGDKYTLEADMPGVSKDNVKVEIVGGMLTISANYDEKKEEKGEDDKYVYRERRCGSMRRSFNVEGIREDDITAEFKDGVLKLTLPKQETKALPETKAIEIQ